MGQLIHIFRKDVRHFWREIVLVLGILTAFGWNAPTGWLPGRYHENVVLEIFAGWLPGLLGLSWMFLILRVVQDEPLVGDRQFWVTRPYDWKQLLGAKVLLIVTFVNASLLILQLVLLRVAGFTPASFVTRLLWIQAIWIAILILPTATLTTVSAGVVTTILTALGIVVFLMAIEALLSQWHLPHPAILGWVPVEALITALLVTFAGVVLWQYARRRTGRARLLLAVAGSAVVMIAAMKPVQPFDATPFAPRIQGQPMPVELAFDAGKHSSATGPKLKDKVSINLPLRVSGIAENSAVEVSGTRVEIEAPGGLHWASGWEGRGITLMPDRSTSTANFDMERSSFERMKAVDATVHLWFAMTALEPSELQRITVGNHAFSVPGGAFCWVVSENPDFIQCRSALSTPFLVASTKSDESTCEATGSADEIATGTMFYGWNWNPYSGAKPEISPIEVFGLRLVHQTSTNEVTARVCPGTPVTFATLREGRRLQDELTIEGIRLADYQVKELGMGALGARAILR